MYKLDIEVDFTKLTRYKFKDFIEIGTTNGGVYLFYSEELELLYLGKSQNLKQRIRQHYNTNTKAELFEYVDILEIEDDTDRDILETYLINKLKPKLNLDKVYTYIPEVDNIKYWTSKDEEEQKIEDKIQEEIAEDLEDFYL